jgi:hypothetical protein
LPNRRANRENQPVSQFKLVYIQLNLKFEFWSISIFIGFSSQTRKYNNILMLCLLHSRRRDLYLTTCSLKIASDHRSPGQRDDLECNARRVVGRGSACQFALPLVCSTVSRHLPGHFSEPGLRPKRNVQKTKKFSARLKPEFWMDHLLLSYWYS